MVATEQQLILREEPAYIFLVLLDIYRKRCEGCYLKYHQYKT